MPWLVPSLQRRWFWCWRPPPSRKAKSLQRRLIGGITRWGSVPNARRACSTTRIHPLSHYQAITSVGNDSKTRNLGFLWFEVKGRWGSFFRLWTTASAEKRKGFLYRIVTGDGNWIYYSNPKRKKSWGLSGHASTSSARTDIHAARVILCIWWDQVGVIYYELLKPNETITGKQYQKQLMRLSRALREKLPQYEQRHGKAIPQHDDAWPHVAKPIKT